MKFSEQHETRLGDIGELSINKFLTDNKFIIYKPINDAAHLIDGFAIRNMNEIIGFEVKTKPKRIYYNDTGIDIKHYNRYKLVLDKYGIEVFLFFVDGLYKKVYGNYLSVLDKEENGYPLNQKGIRYFDLDKMIIIDTIPDEIADMLIIHSKRNYKY